MTTYRSKLEERLAPLMELLGADYEPVALSYPVKPKKYKPDFVLPNGIAIEAKGYLKGPERVKLLLVKQHYPDLDLRLILTTPHQAIGKHSNTSFRQWCERHGFPWAVHWDKDVWAQWFLEPFNAKSAAILGVSR